MSKSIFKKAFGLLNVFRNDSINRTYWNLRAEDIDEQWGNSNYDYATLKEVITLSKAKKILDIGCGSGRLFPLYKELEIKEIVAQDISPKALDLARQRAGQLRLLNVSFINDDLRQLSYADAYFDLIISNRTLSAVFPKDIFETVNKLCSIASNIYLNEMSSLEYSSSTYWFKHDYPKMMLANNYELLLSSEIPNLNQKYAIFRRKSNPSVP